MGNWLLVIVISIFVICMVVGGIKGFFKFGISLLSSVLTVILVACMDPFVGRAIEKYTPLDEMIEDKCVEIFMPEFSEELLSGVDFSNTPLAGYSADEIKDMKKEDWDYLGITPQEILERVGEIPKDQQIKEIEKAGIPQFLKNALLENNNSSIYERLEVEHFTEYIAAYISRMFINVLSFLITFLFAIIIVKALVVAVDIIGELPVVGTLNHVGGVAVGAMTALLIVWIIFLIVTVAYSTKVGKLCFEMIDSSSLLTFLYNKNILLLRLISF